MRTLCCALVALAAGALALPAAAATPAPSPPSTPVVPSAETLALARRVAADDDFLGMVGAVGQAQIEEIEHGLGPLSPAEKLKVETIARARLQQGIDRVIDRLAAIYVTVFSPEDLKATAAFLETPAGRAYSARMIRVLPGLGEAMKGFDYKRDVLADTCAQIAKGCPAKPAPTKP